MNRIEYIFRRIYNGWGAGSYFYDEADEQMICCIGLELQDTDFGIPIKIRQDIRIQYRIIQSPVVVLEEENFYYWGFEDECKNLYVFGPITTVILDAVKIRRYCSINRIYTSDTETKLPVICMSELLSIICISYFMLTEKQINEETLMEKNNWQGAPDEKDDITYSVVKEEQERVHLPYEMEQRWLDSIRNGILKSETEVARNEIQKIEHVGIMAEKNSLKQAEYTAVTGITLMTRAAIDGGCSPDKMYQLSDLYLQKIAKSRSSIEMFDVQKRAVIEFTNAVIRQKEQACKDPYVEWCKDYITKNLYREIKIENMTREIGLSRTYMSNKFSKATGMSITQYIVSEKLKVAANLLRYSEAEIGAISSYLHFSSASRFSEKFKKRYNMTPLEFRSKNKVAEFVDMKIR